MKLQETIQVVDNIMHKETGKHLNDIEHEILVGCWEGKGYPEIAKENNRAENYVKNAAKKLWTKLSKSLGENVKKSNFKTTLERIFNYKNQKITTVSQACCKNNLVTISSELSDNQDREINDHNIINYEVKLVEDDQEIPYLNSFYGLTEELTHLENTIRQKKCRQVSILGVKGIGKTAFTVQLIEQVKSNFNYVIYRSLNTLPNLTQITQDIIQLISPQEAKKITVTEKNVFSLLKYYLSNYRCLIILDDLQNIFQEQQLAGKYKIGYDNYSKMFKIMTQFDSQSCLILVSREQPLDIANLPEDNPYCLSLELTGLRENARYILKDKQLFDDDKWDSLIEIYEGNPFYLKTIARIIKDLCCGSVKDFLAFPQPFLAEEISSILEQQLLRLSPLEIEILGLLTNKNKPIYLSKMPSLSKGNITDLFNAIQSLKRRSHLKTTLENQQVVLKISSIWREYLLNSLF